MEYYSLKSCSGLRKLLGVFMALIACVNLSAQKVSDIATETKEGLRLPGVEVLAPSVTAHRLTVYMSPSDAGSVAIEGIGGGSPAIVAFFEEGQKVNISVTVNSLYHSGYFLDDKGVYLGGTNLLYYVMPNRDAIITHYASKR